MDEAAMNSSSFIWMEIFFVKLSEAHFTIILPQPIQFIIFLFSYLFLTHLSLELNWMGMYFLI